MADNVLPAVLRAKGCIVVSDNVLRHLDKGDMLEYGSDAEVALRACAVNASEQIVYELKLEGHDVSAAQFDYWLWGIAGKSEELRDFPRHWCRSRFY